MAVKFWWPTSMPAQVVLVQNFLAKIPNYAETLGMTEQQLSDAQDLCNGFIDAFNGAEQCRATMLAMTQWRDNIFFGGPAGESAPPAPVFPVVSVEDATLGTVKQFFQLRDRITVSPGYTSAIGEDLGIVGSQITPVPPQDVTPNLKVTASAGYWVNLTGSMQGMDALRVEYAPNDGQFTNVAFLTNTPGGFQITPQTPGQPEAGRIRCVYIKRNAEFGNYSADYPVTVS